MAISNFSIDAIKPNIDVKSMPPPLFWLLGTIFSGRWGEKNYYMLKHVKFLGGLFSVIILYVCSTSESFLMKHQEPDHSDTTETLNFGISQVPFLNLFLYTNTVQQKYNASHKCETGNFKFSSSHIEQVKTG